MAFFEATACYPFNPLTSDSFELVAKNLKLEKISATEEEFDAIPLTYEVSIASTQNEQLAQICKRGQMFNGLEGSAVDSWRTVIAYAARNRSM